MITTTMLTLALTLTRFDSRALAQDRQAASVKAAQVSAPAQVSTIDTGKLKGEPTQLAWSPDGTQLFLQTSERDAAGMIRNPRFFVMSVADGKPSPANAPPAWAAEYWTWKSGQFAPGSTTYGVDLKEEQRTATATAAPMGGSLSRGAPDSGTSGTSVDDVAMRAQQQQKQRVITLAVKGEVVGEFVGVQFLPGYTFSWSPASIAMIAYTNASGRLALMDREGQKQPIDGTKNVILPAWSADGSKIAFLQKAGKNKYDLCLVEVRP
jgi:Tol biopolymer transport system component